MASVNVSEAAKLAGISRSHFYKAYIKSGKISQSRDESGKPVIDISELMRIFPVLIGGHMNTVNYEKSGQITQHFTQNEKILLERISGLKALLEARAEEITEYREREKQLYRVLGQGTEKKRRWWFPF